MSYVPSDAPFVPVFTASWLYCITALTEVFANEAEETPFPLGNFALSIIADRRGNVRCINCPCYWLFAVLHTCSCQLSILNITMNITLNITLTSSMLIEVEETKVLHSTFCVTARFTIRLWNFKFHLDRLRVLVFGPKTLRFWNFTNTIVSKGWIPCTILTKFAGFMRVHSLHNPAEFCCFTSIKKL